MRDLLRCGLVCALERGERGCDRVALSQVGDQRGLLLCGTGARGIKNGLPQRGDAFASSGGGQHNALAFIHARRFTKINLGLEIPYASVANRPVIITPMLIACAVDLKLSIREAGGVLMTHKPNSTAAGA